MSVLDASAVLALLNDEPGAQSVARHLEGGASISSVNYAEVVSKLSDYGMPADAIQDALAELGLQVAPFTEDQARICGYLRAPTREAGLSLGDRACLALATVDGAVAVTADRGWSGLAGIAVEIELVR